ncbi:hypothetical protein [Ramlibacter sp. WS9]|nr:hypothetical protein [Ramlibacter sp. WS9]
MNTTTHSGKRLMQTMFNGLVIGDSKLFLNSLHVDLCWTRTGALRVKPP